MCWFSVFICCGGSVFMSWEVINSDLKIQSWFCFNVLYVLIFCVLCYCYSWSVFMSWETFNSDLKIQSWSCFIVLYELIFCSFVLRVIFETWGFFENSLFSIYLVRFAYILSWDSTGYVVLFVLLGLCLMSWENNLILF